VDNIRPPMKNNCRSKVGIQVDLIHNFWDGSDYT